MVIFNTHVYMCVIIAEGDMHLQNSGHNYNLANVQLRAVGKFMTLYMYMYM